MQSSTTTTTTTSAHRRTNVPSQYRNRNHGPAPARANARFNAFPLVSKPVQPASNKDFHLDTLFNPVWMSGPHVFSFSKDGTVVRPETYHEEPYPGYRKSVASSLGRDVHGDGATLNGFSSSIHRARASKALERMDKPWKNVAITEQDDAEFAAMELEAEIRARAEARSNLMGLVYTWPPKPQPAPCSECEVLTGPRRREADWGMGARVSAVGGTPKSAMPALSYGSSAESESESEVFRVVPGRGGVGRRKEVPPEKSVGFGRVQRKAQIQTPPRLPGVEEGEGESEWARFAARGEIGKAGGDRFSSLFVPEKWVEDELTVKLREILRIPDI